MNRKSADFRRYAISSHVKGTAFDDYFRKTQNNNTPYLVEDNGMQVDIFSRLLEDRIIFLSTDIDDYVCNMIKAQLIYLQEDSDEDIKIYIDSGGGSVYSGLGLLDVMEYVKPDIITVNTGLAASMAAVGDGSTIERQAHPVDREPVAPEVLRVVERKAAHLHRLDRERLPVLPALPERECAGHVHRLALVVHRGSLLRACVHRALVPLHRHLHDGE